MISMISTRTLELVNLVCKFVRGNVEPLGGLPAIFIGDFLQLPPVPNLPYADKGEHSFKHPEFMQMVPHKVNLVEVCKFYFTNPCLVIYNAWHDVQYNNKNTCCVIT
jgi:hypothetical protein